MNLLVLEELHIKKMKINYKKISAYLVSLSLIFIPLFIFADSSATTIQNPLQEDDINEILVNIMNIVATVGAIVVVFFIIYSGFKFVTARGNPEELKNAKNIFYATIVGGAILLGADIIANVVVETVRTTVN